MTTFKIFIHPRFTLKPCEKMLAEEARGLIGWHSFSTCPDCQHTPNGVELWGENGHKQGSFTVAPTQEEIPELVRRFSTARSKAEFEFSQRSFTYRA